MNCTIRRSRLKGIEASRKRFSSKAKKDAFPQIFKASSNSLAKTNGTKLISIQVCDFTCFINKKRFSEYEVPDTTPIPKSVSNILSGNIKNRMDKNGKNNLLSLNITTKNWCLYDSQKNKYIGFRQTYKRQIASLTKIMTTLLSIQFITSFKISLNCKVKITKNAVSMTGTTAQLKRNYWISIEDLLYGTMLPSGNDAAYTISEYLGYLMLQFTIQNKPNEYFSSLEKIDLVNVNTTNYVKQFVSCMNERVNFMDLYSTRFSNPHGLQNALNASSALDIIKLSIDASKNQLFKKIMNTIYWKYNLYQSDQFRRRICKKWWNTNRLLQKDWQGIKTGQTVAAGGCLSSLKQGIYIVVLNSTNAQTRFSDTETIFNWYLGKKDNAKDQKLTMSLNIKQRAKQGIITALNFIQDIQTQVSL